MSIRTIDIRTINQALRYWAFFLEGLSQTPANESASQCFNEDYLLKLVMQLSTKPSNEYSITIFTDDVGTELLGYVIAFNSTPKFYPRTLHVYFFYSTNKRVNFSKHAAEWLRAWARVNGYKRMTAVSVRFSGGSFRFFEKTLGFSRESVNFSMTL